VEVEALANRSRREAYCIYSELISTLAAASSACSCFTVGVFRFGVMDTFPNKAKI
jgi:hypothetical protein